MTIAAPAAWDHVTDNDIVDASQVFDPAYTILEAVFWNQARGRRKYPFEVKTLVRLLTGNDYFERRRGRNLRDIEFFGWLERLRKREDTLTKSSVLNPHKGNTVLMALVFFVFLFLAAGCATLPTLPLAQDHLLFQGHAVSMTGEPATDRLVVAFLDGREVGRAVTRCTGTGCAFTLTVPWPSQAGEAPSPVDLGQIPEGESRPYRLPARPGEPAGHTYVVQVLAGDKDDLPPEFLTERLGMLPDGLVVVIGEGARPSQGLQLPRLPGIPADRAMLGLLLLSCCAGLVAVLAGAAFVVLVARTLRVSENL